MYLSDLLGICQANHVAVVREGELRPYWEGCGVTERGLPIDFDREAQADGINLYVRVNWFSEYYDPRHGGGIMIEVER